MKKEFIEIVLATLVIFAVSYTSYRQGKTDAFKDMKEIIKEIQTLNN